MIFTMDQDFIEVPSGEGVEVGDYLGLVCYYPGRPPFPAWNCWVKVLGITETSFRVQFQAGEKQIAITTKDRSVERSTNPNKWVKKVTTREYKADQEPVDDEELL
jgi:hypothetical protein